jgi:S1-C subfamily serine protease
MKLMMITAVAAFAAAAQAGDAPRAIPIYKNYKLRTGQSVAMSASQYAIANKEWHALEPETIADVASKITVLVMVEKNDGTHVQGTGFFINSQEVLTNWHVARDADNITVVYSDGERCNAQLSISKPSMDLATIIVPSIYNKIWAHFDTDSDWERIGEKVYVYGNPQGMEGTFSEGILSAWRVNGVFMQISAPIDSGSSGSPVFNQYGLVIGIVKESITSSAQLNIAISSNAIYEALELKTDDHPNGFDLGVAKGIEMRTPSEIDADIAIANAARIEAENKKRAATGQTESEKLKERSDELIRANNERVLKSLPPKNGSAQNR